MDWWPNSKIVRMKDDCYSTSYLTRSKIQREKNKTSKNMSPCVKFEVCILFFFFHLFLMTAWFKSLLFPSTSFRSDLKTKIWLQHTMPMNRPHYSIKTVTLVYGCLFWVTAWIYLDASTKVLDVIKNFWLLMLDWPPRRFHDFITVFVSFESVRLFFSFLFKMHL